MICDRQLCPFHGESAHARTRHDSCSASPLCGHQMLHHSKTVAHSQRWYHPQGSHRCPFQATHAPHSTPQLHIPQTMTKTTVFPSYLHLHPPPQRALSTPFPAGGSPGPNGCSSASPTSRCAVSAPSDTRLPQLFVWRTPGLIGQHWPFPPEAARDSSISHSQRFVKLGTVRETRVALWRSDGARECLRVRARTVFHANQWCMSRHLF